MLATILTDTHDTPADFWQEFTWEAPKEPLPEARLEDDYDMMQWQGLSHYQSIFLLSQFHAMMPATVWSRLRQFQPRNTDHILQAVRMFGSPRHSRRWPWRVLDAVLGFLALQEDRVRHLRWTPPGWRKVG